MKKFITLFSMMAMLAFSSQAAYYLVGNEPFGNGWNPNSGVELTDNGTGEYTFKATINGSIWFVLADALADAGDWTTFNNTLRIGPTNGDETVTAGQWVSTQKSGGDHGAYKFTGTGEEYVITYIPAISKFMISGYVAPITIDFYTVAGSPASVFGTEWDPSNTDNDMTKLEDGTYELVKTGCELGEGTQLAFKVAGNHSWDNAWPNDNVVVTIEESGTYDLKITFNPATNEVGYELTKQGDFSVLTGDLFILGEVNDLGWDPSNGLKMETEDGNIFTANFTTAGNNIDENDGIGYSYFHFTTKLGANSEDWESISAYRVGATVNDFLLSDDMMGIEIGLGGFGQPNSFKIPAGEYDVTVNLDAMTMLINKVEVVPEQTEAPTITSEVNDDSVIITATGEGEVHLYVNGEEVENPYTIARGEEDVTVVVTATAQEEGKLISETATVEVVVPAKEVIEPEAGYKIEKVWEMATPFDAAMTGDLRQGFGMNGKFFINNKADQKVVVVDENGLANIEYLGGANCGITRDEAGNLVISNAAFPGAWVEATIKVINPETNEMKEYTVPEECGLLGRCDFLGFAKGNLMEDGVLYLTGGNTGTEPFTNGVAIMTIAGGEVSVDECYTAACDGLTGQTSTVINYYKDINNEEALMYAYRSAAPSKLTFDGENLVRTPVELPNKGHANGIFPFVWDGMELFIYPIMPDYQNGFAIAEAGAENAIAEVPTTVAANANAFQANWLNAEVGEDEVIIYQYYPGGNIAVYRLTKDTGNVEELINNENKIVAGVRYYNIMGQEMKEANGITIIVTTYTDGSSSAVKVIK